MHRLRDFRMMEG